MASPFPPSHTQVIAGKRFKTDTLNASIEYKVSSKIQNKIFLMSSSIEFSG